MYFERDSLDWFNMAFKIIISDMHDNKSWDALMIMANYK
jgi:hypothetical protein